MTIQRESGNSRTTIRPGSVAAVVPTFERDDALAACLSALDRQTRPPDVIFVVDGAARREARAVAEACGRTRYVPLSANGGSAGGFRVGMQLAWTDGFEWTWLADDDAWPAENALELLLDAAREIDGRVFNSLVVTPDGRTINWDYHLYLHDRYDEGYRTISTVAELEALGQKVVNGLAQFNTGSLIHRDVVDAVGYHDPGFFIRGEEVDYVLRMQRAGFKTYTVVGSRYYHPREERFETRLFGRRSTYPVMSPMKQYYCLRNGLINLRRYNFRGERVALAAARLVLSNVRMALASRTRRWLRLAYAILAVRDGLAGRAIVRTFGR